MPNTFPSTSARGGDPPPAPIPLSPPPQIPIYNPEVASPSPLLIIILSYSNRAALHLYSNTLNFQ